MNSNKTNKIHWFVKILIIWLFLKNIGYLLSYSNVTDYNLWNIVGWPAIYFILGISNALIAGLMIYYFWRPHKVGYMLTMVGCGWLIFDHLIDSILVFLNLDLARQFYIQSREARGMSSITSEKLDFMFSTSGFLLTAGIWLILFLFFMSYVYKRKNYFLNKNH